MGYISHKIANSRSAISYGYDIITCKSNRHSTSSAWIELTPKICALSRHA